MSQQKGWVEAIESLKVDKHLKKKLRHPGYLGKGGRMTCYFCRMTRETLFCILQAVGRKYNNRRTQQAGSRLNNAHACICVSSAPVQGGFVGSKHERVTDTVKCEYTFKVKYPSIYFFGLVA